ncbi:hypothetical protein AVEN_78926-1 [Araneus ventricosus]|uniref:Peptidase M13 C-terminal domain-containing protein n=1 Tax=Araneus ventricosus TaxID=182803 RepID=A0A4Y2J293_ARAVE|nr:hypothetical protein AVEN_78926-1 [Araneus ventricosus]
MIAGNTPLGIRGQREKFHSQVWKLGDSFEESCRKVDSLTAVTIATGYIWCEVLSKEANERYVKDNHSPGKYRANIPLINSPEFSAVFNCPSGTPMNPVKKCRLWG